MYIMYIWSCGIQWFQFMISGEAFGPDKSKFQVSKFKYSVCCYQAAWYNEIGLLEK